MTRLSRATSRRFLLRLASGACCFGVLAFAAAGAEPLRVVASNTILADLVRAVSGPDADVRCLVAPGVDLHGFEPKPGDVVTLAEANLVVVNGAGFEPWLERLLANSGFAGPVVYASDGCPLFRRGGAPLAGGSAPAGQLAPASAPADALDPHAWQDPANTGRYVANLRDALVALAPDRAEAFRRRAALFAAELETFDAWARRLFGAMPPADRRIVTSHDALAYFGRAYGLEIIPVRGLDPQQEPDARQVARLVAQLREQHVRAVFFESVSNPKMLEQLSRDTGVTLGGELFTDSVGPAGSGADNYLGMMRENVLAIAAALERH